MKVRSLSFSAISMFRQCPWKFARVYHYKDPRPMAFAAIEGSLVHDVLETWMVDRTIDWKEILKDTVANKISEWSGDKVYTLLTPEQYTGACELLKAFSERKDLPHKDSILSLEKRFDFTLPNGIPINGRIDRIDDEGTHINFIDYKTTRAFIWKSEVEQSLQGAMYILAGRHLLYPGRDFKFTIDALRFNPVSVIFTSDFLDNVLDYLELTWDEIETTKPESAHTVTNKYCGFCQYRDKCDAANDMTVTDWGEGAYPDLKTYARRILELEEQEKYAKKLRVTYENHMDQQLVAAGSRHADFGDSYVFYKEKRGGGAAIKVVDKSGEIK